MALVKFYRGPKSKYSPETFSDGIYFSLDTQEIIVNGNAFGYNVEDHREIVTVDYTAPSTITITYANGEKDVVELQIATAGTTAANSSAGLMSAADVYKLSKIEDSADVNLIEIVKVNDKALVPDTNKAVNIDLTDIEDTIAKNQVEAADKSIVVTDGSISGTTVTKTKIKVKLQSNGGILLDDNDGLKLEKVALETYKGDSKAITVGTVDSNNQKEVGLKLNTTKGNILTATADGLYASVKLKSLTVDSATSPNVASRYGLVGLQPDGTEISVGDVTIDILKDRFLKKVELTKIPSGQSGAGDDALAFTFILADGTESVSYINVADFLREAEAGDGLQITNGIYSVKLDTSNIESNPNAVKYLRLTSDGIQLTGINAEIAKAKTEVVAKSSGHVQVAVTTGTDGHSIATVSETDIASAANLEALTAELEWYEGE